MTNHRWEGDERGEGVGNGVAHLPELDALRAALRTDHWIAEAPETLLLPQLVRVCARHDSPWVIDDDALDNGVLVVDLFWTGTGNARELRRDLFALLGEIAENATHVRQIVLDDRIEFRVATGMLIGDSPFAPHGHLLTFRIGGDRLPAILEGMRQQTG